MVATAALLGGFALAFALLLGLFAIAFALLLSGFAVALALPLGLASVLFALRIVADAADGVLIHRARVHAGGRERSTSAGRRPEVT